MSLINKDSEIQRCEGPNCRFNYEFVLVVKRLDDRTDNGLPIYSSYGISRQYCLNHFRLALEYLNKVGKTSGSLLIKQIQSIEDGKI